MERFFIVLSVLLINGVAGDEITVKVGESVTLNSGVEKTPDQVILWYFKGVRIAYINGVPSKTCLYYGVDGMFRDRLQDNYNTGDLIIKNVTVAHSGLYEANDLSNTDGKTITLQNNKTQTCNRAKISRGKLDDKIIKTFSVTVIESNTRIQDPTSNPAESGMSFGAITGISVCVAVLLLAAAAAAVVIYYKRRNRGEYPEKNKQALMTT